MHSTPQLFVFNMIGTVFDAKGIYVRAFSQACKLHNLDLASRSERVKSAIGNKRLIDMVADLFPEMTLEEFRSFQITCNTIRDDMLATECQPFPHVFEAVSYLHSIGHETALITGTAGQAVERLDGKYALTKIFSEENIFSRDLEKTQIWIMYSLKSDNCHNFNGSIKIHGYRL